MTPAINAARWRSGRRGAVAAIALALLLCLGSAADATAAPVKVGPGIYLSDASETDRSGPISPAARRALHSDPSPRVVGGSSTTIANWPWMTAIAVSPSISPNGPLQRFFCGGTLVAPTLVITAAHCMFDAAHNTFTPANRYTAITGRTQLSFSSEGQEIPFAGYQFFTDASGNPLYSPASSDFDVVLVSLASPSSASPIQLAGPDEAATWERGRDAYVTGWGATSEGGGRTDVLQAAQIGIIGDSTCGASNSYGAAFHATFMVCAGRMAGRTDTCQGDSGGPLVVPLAAGGFRLVGDTSFGLGCATPFFPGVYGRIAADPMRSALANAAIVAAGANIVGSGGQPGPQSAPQTEFVDGPPKKTSKKRVRFEFFSSKDGATFTCKLDKKAEVPCDSPVSFKAKHKGKHRLEVTATIFGITEPTPAAYKWKYTKNAAGGGGHPGGGGGGGGVVGAPGRG